MKLLTKGWATLAALVAGGLLTLTAGTARAADIPGRMTIHDDAHLFSEGAKRDAERRMSAARFDRGLHFHVDTYKSVPADRLSAYNAASNKNEYVYRWAQDVATGDKAKGPYTLIVMSPNGHTQVVLDTETRNRGFDDANRRHVAEIFNKAFLESAKKPVEERQAIRDRALLEATDYVINDLKGTKVVHTDGTPTKDTKAATTKRTGMSIGGWICLGIVVLLAIWLVVGIIRALTSPAYAGGGGYGGGPGYGGGGGGFGFGTALLGGMFGAMAGMWLYNSMMGTHYPPQAFGGEATAGDAHGADTGDTGAGDYSGGSATDTGGDYGGGDGGGGGDYGGGGGDYGGGGGDYGGGDYGGGGGDYGGGGDFGGGGGDYGGGGDF